MALVEIKDFNALIDNKLSFHQPVKKQEGYEKLIEMSRKDTTTIQTIQQETYYTFHTIKIIIKLLVLK